MEIYSGWRDSHSHKCQSQMDLCSGSYHVFNKQNKNTAQLMTNETKNVRRMQKNRVKR